MGQQDAFSSERYRRTARWLRRVAAGALALTLGLGQACADEVVSAHKGGQGRDKASAFAAAGDGAARASSSGSSVDVTGSGVASADAGGSIGISDAEVKVSTWGRTSAEVL